MTFLLVTGDAELTRFVRGLLGMWASPTHWPADAGCNALETGCYIRPRELPGATLPAATLPAAAPARAGKPTLGHDPLRDRSRL